jgi:SSS family solute:Na+ symporter
VNGYFNTGDWLIILSYLGGIIALGVWFGKDQRTTRDYFLGSRNIPWWGIGFSIIAAETSALTIIGVPAIAYGSNMLFIQMIIGYVIARIILAVVMVPHYLKGEIYSPYQLLEQHLGKGPRHLAGAFFLFLETMAAGVRVFVACIPIRLMLGEQICSLGGLVDPILGAILLFVGLSLLYTYIGGVKAVIWTDAVQFGLFLAGGIFALLYIPTLIDGGWAVAMERAAAAGKLAWLNTEFTLSAPFNLWMGIIGGTVMVLSTHGAEQLIVQRVLACSSVREGRKALALSAVLIFPLFLIFLLVGVLLWVFYQSHPFQIALPESRPGIKSVDFIFPIFHGHRGSAPAEGVPHCGDPRGRHVLHQLGHHLPLLGLHHGFHQAMDEDARRRVLPPFQQRLDDLLGGRPGWGGLADPRSPVCAQCRVLPARTDQRRPARGHDPRPLRPRGGGRGPPWWA